MHVPRRLGWPAGDFLEDVRIHETCAWRNRSPLAGIVSADMPRRRAAHRKAADADAIFIDGVMFADVFKSLEGVDFANEFVRVAKATVGMEHERVRRGEFAAIVFAVGDEAEFAEFNVATVIPEVEAMLVVGGGIEGGRDDEAVRLDGAIDFRFVAANDEAGGAVPRGPAVAERAGAGMTFVEEFFGRGKVVGGVKDVVIQGVPDGVQVDLDVGEEIEEFGSGLERFLEIVNFMAERGDSGFQFALDLGWDRNAFRWGSDVLADGRICGEGENGR